ncbi:family 20 glycosylhydrolase [Hymenobacter lutimineralis]|uniref:Family 20 glycosylhydrolase n=1 Tax=Hymenobacter lutimineralis TaxID=2606448 RepID=A0A5D6UZ50_9BACT|nr:family 20 glycosylhydrolase [Hymenobacter lutimineralis]TYZ08696.1 family 20 glycosylhydrolase [Hymenobacter lutimineralis]
MILRFPFLLLLLALPALSARAQSVAPTATRNLLPVPTEVRWGKSSLPWKATLRPQMEGPVDSMVTAAVLRTLNRLHRNGAAAPPNTALPLQIRYGRTGHAEAFDEERYSLRVTPMGVTIDAPTTLGVLRALATLEQLPEPQGRHSVLPEVDITDQPRFPWRGLLMDAARHFMPVAVIKRNLDAMAAVKLNVFHWHLADDQGFRVESSKLPNLHTIGGSGQFYTQAQVRDVVRYAQARGIRVIPEFDVPGHATAWLAAYPQLASNDSIYGVSPRWGVLNIAMDPTKETTYALLDTLFGEMTPLFPDPYFHIGGDENDGRQWRRNPTIVQFMRDHSMLNAKGQPDKHQLQTYFNRRVLSMVQRYGKKMVGWDEILGPGLPTDAVIQSWRGKKGLYDAAKAGHQALLSNGYYIDLYLTAASHYLPDPLPADAPLTEDEKKRILGGEATMWAEFADSVIVDSRIWPRAAAVAERLWSAQRVADVADMYRRLPAVSRQLETLGLMHRRAPEQLLLQLAGGPTQIAPLRTFAEVLEPVKEYKRHFQGFKYTTQTPLTRLVDAAPAESEVARLFSTRVDSLLALLKSARGQLPRTPAARQLVQQLSTQLRTWQLNDVQVQPILAANPTLREYTVLSSQLSAASTLGLARLVQLEKGVAPSPEWYAIAAKQLEAAKAPAGQTELAVVPALRRLVGDR